MNIHTKDIIRTRTPIQMKFQNAHVVERLVVETTDKKRGLDKTMKTNQPSLHVALPHFMTICRYNPTLSGGDRVDLAGEIRIGESEPGGKMQKNDKYCKNGYRIVDRITMLSRVHGGMQIMY